MPPQEPNSANQKSREKGWGAGVARQPPWNNQKDPFLMMSTKKLDGSERVPKPKRDDAVGKAEGKGKGDASPDGEADGVGDDSDSGVVKTVQEEKVGWKRTAWKMFSGARR